MGSDFSLNSPLTNLPGVGPASAAKLAKLGLTSVRDLLCHFPSRYLDYTKQTPIAQLRAKVNACFQGKISHPHRFVSRTGKLVFQVTATDASGSIKLAWFNSPYLINLLDEGKTYLFAGKPAFWGETLTVVAPQFEPLEGNSLHTRGLVPIYPQTAKLTSKWLRRQIHFLLQSLSLTEPLPDKILKEMALPSLDQAFRSLHFPQTKPEQAQADRRLAFNHHLALNLTNLRERLKLPPSPVIKVSSSLHQKLLRELPFKLTPGQQKAIDQSYQDLGNFEFTHRLIQGETGSGKTVIAYCLARQVLSNKYSFCLLAPTRILAEQHAHTFTKLGLSQDSLRLVTADKRFRQPKRPTVFIGTHALLSQLPNHLEYPLAVLIIDEQHRFGVAQRETLLKRTPSPHLFSLTATPIPRTVALGLFGEIEFSFINTKPRRQLPVKTWVVSPERFKKSHPWLVKHLQKDEKVFVVCPLINQSAQNPQLANVTTVSLQYQKDFGQIAPIFTLHGQLKSDHLGQTLQAFRHAERGLLVSTSLIEVGLDIPAAQVIIIHSAERFGLATLHQLRGRVGRAGGQGYCFLVPSSEEETEIERLKLLENHHSGLTLAKLDLKLRGAGELAGAKQHGFVPVRLASFWDRTLFKRAKSIAQTLLAKDPVAAAKIAQKLSSW